MRIMYVEDNEVNLGLVRRIAKMGEHEVLSFPNGEDALAALAKEDVDLILMDIELEGELDGIEVVKRLRARGDQRPIVAVTAYAMVGDKERIIEAGCNDYLPKPLPVAQFLTVLAKFDPANSPATMPAPETTSTSTKPATEMQASSTDLTTEASAATPVVETPETNSPLPMAVAQVQQVVSAEENPATASPSEVETKTTDLTEVTDTLSSDVTPDSQPAVETATRQITFEPPLTGDDTRHFIPEPISQAAASDALQADTSLSLSEVTSHQVNEKGVSKNEGSGASQEKSHE